MRLRRSFVEPKSTNVSQTYLPEGHEIGAVEPGGKGVFFVASAPLARAVEQAGHGQARPERLPREAGAEDAGLARQHVQDRGAVARRREPAPRRPRLRRRPARRPQLPRPRDVVRGAVRAPQQVPPETGGDGRRPRRRLPPVRGDGHLLPVRPPRRDVAVDGAAEGPRAIPVGRRDDARAPQRGDAARRARHVDRVAEGKVVPEEVASAAVVVHDIAVGHAVWAALVVHVRVVCQEVSRRDAFAVFFAAKALLWKSGDGPLNMH